MSQLPPRIEESEGYNELVASTDTTQYICAPGFRCVLCGTMYSFPARHLDGTQLCAGNDKTRHKEIMYIQVANEMQIPATRREPDAPRIVGI